MTDSAAGRVEIVYVSWGGTGRGAALRAAYRRAAEASAGLVYLAILDPPTFADLQHDLTDLVADELEWLLTSQLRMIVEEANDEIPVRVLVKTGNVDDEVAHLVAAIEAVSVLVGAPVAVAGEGTVDGLLHRLTQRTGVPVEVIDPEGVR